MSVEHANVTDPQADDHRNASAGRWRTDAITQDMTRRYLQDKQSMRQIAEALGCSYTTVNYVLTAAHVKKRSKGGSNRRTRQTSTGSPPSSQTYPS